MRYMLRIYVNICVVVSQTKWIWYKKSRPASHLAYFDSASRGPWGSLLLFF
jgi:hypothetical protein